MCWDRDWVVKVTKRVGQLAQERRLGEGEQVSHKKVQWDYTSLYTSGDREKNPALSHWGTNQTTANSTQILCIE